MTITRENITKGANLKLECGSVFIIESVFIENNMTLVRSTLKGGGKGNYLNEINDVVKFFNEEKAVVL